MSTGIECPICGHTKRDWLGDHIVEVHGMSLDAFKTQYPGVPLASDRLIARQRDATGNVRRAHPPALTDLTVDMGPLTFEVNYDVPEHVCLPLPPNYQFPRAGELGKDVSNALVSLKRGRSIYIWGLPGSGKDALFHAWSAMTRTPAIIKQVIPGSDIEGWFFSRGFNEEGTFWEEGDVLKALRDGYTTQTGRVIPYLLLVSDLDRADRAQAEYLRLITDTIKGRISGPTGAVYNVLAGTRVVATANTAGGGDERGRMISANPLDGSILDRFDRKYQFHYMEWKDEEPIVKAKFPYLLERAPWVFDAMGKATKALRDAVKQNELYAEFSHRGLCAILEHAEDLLYCADRTKVPGTLLKMAARAWIDGLPDQAARDKARTVMDPHVKGGMVNQGSTAHIGSGGLADI